MNEFVLMAIKCAFLLIILLQVVPIMAWVERRGSALMQNRLGPNRVGPLGLFQSLADAVKFIWKEDPIPGHVNPVYYVLAPIIALTPAFMTFAVIPLAEPIAVNFENGFSGLMSFQIADLDVGLLYILAISSLSIYGIMMAGWASNNKYAMLGGIRSSSQLISYELSLGLSIIGVIMVFSSVQLGDMVSAQSEPLLTLGPLTIPKWGIFVQPLGFLIFMVAGYAETNRLPFDLPEGESEIVAGYHLEYGSMKFAFFMMAEYLHMTTISGLLATFYFGGWQLLPGMEWGLGLLSLEGDAYAWGLRAMQFLSLVMKVMFFMWLFVWVRWTLPRFRFDQLMNLGWKVLLPLSLANIFLTGILIALKVF